MVICLTRMLMDPELPFVADVFGDVQRAWLDYVAKYHRSWRFRLQHQDPTDMRAEMIKKVTSGLGSSHLEYFKCIAGWDAVIMCTAAIQRAESDYASYTSLPGWVAWTKAWFSA